jgi:hypothetical protein
MHPVAPSPVGSGLNHASLVPPSTDNEEVDLAQLGMALAAYLDKEGIEIDVENSGGHAIQVLGNYSLVG